MSTVLLDSVSALWELVMLRLGYVQKFDNAKLKFHQYLGPALPPPPPEIDWSLAITRPLDMLGNADAGCCTISDIGHVINLQLANGSGDFSTLPTGQDVLDFYFNMTGGADVGASLSQAATLAKSVGLVGHKIRSYMDVHPGDQSQAMQSIYLFKALAIGVSLPKSAMDAFLNGKDWVVADDYNILGGHDIPCVGYDADGMTCITWGKYQRMSWAWYATYCHEAQARLYADHIDPGATVDPNGFNWDQLEADEGLL